MTELCTWLQSNSKELSKFYTFTKNLAILPPLKVKNRIISHTQIACTQIEVGPPVLKRNKEKQETVRSILTLGNTVRSPFLVSLVVYLFALRENDGQAYRGADF
jgi:hypothetical protein